MTEINHNFTTPPSVPVIADGETTFNINASGWLTYWKNTILSEMNALVGKLNIFSTEVDETVVVIDTLKTDTADLKAETIAIKNTTQNLHDGTVILKADTQTIYDSTVAFANASFGNTFNASGWDNATDFLNKTTHHNGGWWASLEAVANVNVEPAFTSASWAYVGEHRTEITLTTATHTAVAGEYIKVNATTIGSNVVITLPATPGNRQSVTLLNMDSVNTNTLTIARGYVLHRIIGKLENAEMNCLCEKTLVFEEITQNWILK